MLGLLALLGEVGIQVPNGTHQSLCPQQGCHAPTQAKHEMAILVADKCVRHTRQAPLQTKAAQQTILQVLNSVLSMQSMWCHRVSEQLMAAGATDQDIMKISQVMAQTVRQLEAGNTPPESGLGAHSLPCGVVVSDEEFSSGECAACFPWA